MRRPYTSLDFTVGTDPNKALGRCSRRYARCRDPHFSAGILCRLTQFRADQLRRGVDGPRSCRRPCWMRIRCESDANEDSPRKAIRLSKIHSHRLGFTGQAGNRAVQCCLTTVSLSCPRSTYRHHDVVIRDPHARVISVAEDLRVAPRASCRIPPKHGCRVPRRQSRGRGRYSHGRCRIRDTLRH